MPSNKMKVNIQLLNLKKVTQEKNPGIQRAIKNALDELNPDKCYRELWNYIDGDPVHIRKLFLN